MKYVGWYKKLNQKCDADTDARVSRIALLLYIIVELKMAQKIQTNKQTKQITNKQTKQLEGLQEMLSDIICILFIRFYGYHYLKSKLGYNII